MYNTSTRKKITVSFPREVYGFILGITGIPPFLDERKKKLSKLRLLLPSALSP